MNPRSSILPNSSLARLLPAFALLLGLLGTFSAAPAEAQVPNAPTNLTVIAGDTKLEVMWTAPSGTVTSYDVHYTSGTANINAPVQGGATPNPGLGWVDAGHTATTSVRVLNSTSTQEAIEKYNRNIR